MFEIVIYNGSGSSSEWVRQAVFQSASRIFWVGAPSGEEPRFADRCTRLEGRIGSSGLIRELVGQISGDALLFLDARFEPRLDEAGLKRLLGSLAPGTGIVYSDHDEKKGNSVQPHPVNDYHTGSIRDDFDFGPVLVVSAAAAKTILGKPGHAQDFEYAGFYDLRLRISEGSRILHIPEYLYAASERGGTGPKGGERLFDYVDPANRSVQIEMEQAATDHLKRIGAYLKPVFDEVPEDESKDYPVEASVIIPVKNRAGTIREAIASALGQKTDFAFNVIVVDNHSGDGTGDVLAAASARNGSLLHLIPGRTDLGIGGCWNEAIYSAHCGRYAVQLDSDDLYSGPATLQSLVDLLRTDRYAMAIGSYQLVNSRLEPIPPGLIDHREWTEDNGRNNALRINGLGAPRAFVTRLIRETGFPNVSYGEDYAAALTLSRRYRIGRIYENLYLCRRWEGNTDSALSQEQKNRNDAYKDGVRTREIIARRKMNE